MYIFYTTIGTLIEYINSKGDDQKNRYVIASTGNVSTWPKIEGIGSADPKDFFLPEIKVVMETHPMVRTLETFLNGVQLSMVAL